MILYGASHRLPELRCRTEPRRVLRSEGVVTQMTALTTRRGDARAFAVWLRVRLSGTLARLDALPNCRFSDPLPDPRFEPVNRVGGYWVNRRLGCLARLSDARRRPTAFC